MGERSEQNSPFPWESVTGDDILGPDMADLLNLEGPEESLAESVPSFPKDSNEQDAGLSGNKRSMEPAKKPRASRRKKNGRKKPPGIPKRPLCAYNFFFQKERMKLQGADTPKVGFEELGRIVGKRWKDLSEEDRKQYTQLAKVDSTRYRNEMDAYRVNMRRKADEESSSKDSQDRSAPEPETSSEPCFLPFPPTADGGVPPVARLARPQFVPVPGAAQRRPSQGEDTFWNQQRGVLPAPMQSDMFGPQQLNRQSFAVPPGLEIFLPDASGREQKFTVKYTMVSMAREDAERYMASLMPAIAQGAARQPGAANPQQQQGPMHGRQLPTPQPSMQAAMLPPMPPPDHQQYSYSGRSDAPPR